MLRAVVVLVVVEKAVVVVAPPDGPALGVPPIAHDPNGFDIRTEAPLSAVGKWSGFNERERQLTL